MSALRPQLHHFWTAVMAVVTTGSFVGIAVAAAMFDADLAVTPPSRGRQRHKQVPKPEDSTREAPWLITTTDEKLKSLLDAGFTSAEIALATASKLRTIEDRRRRVKEGKANPSARNVKLDAGVDALFSIYSLLAGHGIESTNIRAWLIGRSMYLEEQRPSVLLSANEFELVREAAIAYATGKTPNEFLAGRNPLPRPAEPKA